MKSFFTIILFTISTIVFPQTINFDTAENWAEGDGALTSYEINHIYTESVGAYTATFTGGEALRQTTTEQDGFPGAFGTWAWRLRDVNNVDWRATISATSLEGFSFKVRRWDGSPSPNFAVDFSTDGGTNWTNSGTINNTFLDNSSNWKTFNYTSTITGTSGIIVRISSSSTTERIMVDDFTYDSPTPVELISFTASVASKGVMLNWSTATEVNNYGFEIERSFAENWEKIGFVEGHGNSYSPKDYSFYDNSPLNGEVKYRLKQIDTDGAFEYHEEVTVNVKGLGKVVLHQNHPNPFNPSTAISFSLPEVTYVKVVVYNAIGQQVAELANGEMEAGSHSVDFDGSSLSSGMYFYRLETASYSKTMKMMLIK